MGPKRGRARMASHGRGGRGATGQGIPIEDIGDQGVASQTQQGSDRGATSRSRRTHQFAREVAVAMLEMERTRHEEIRIQREVTSARFREGMKEFRKMNPPSFDGLGDPLVAGHCLSQIRKIFDTVRITEDDMKLGAKANVSGNQFYYFGKFQQEETKRQQMFRASIPASSPNPSNPGRISKSQIVCHRCNQLGHIRSECPQRVCYNYGQQGHISTNCPQGKNTHSGVGSVQQQSSGHLIISKGTNNRGTNLNSRVSQLLLSEI
ncbi:hypothetical protein Acr_00g0055900 [Actinidia rufa]|uniref:CCHC-type domain-containing protein n=1 Tax=Actinidia rufa TaxID=165716 RepID=A0A7J0DM81_9ERIC|nr:hypothetical protein Acr_00g0055900 [Actinidia rufa]